MTDIVQYWPALWLTFKLATLTVVLLFVIGLPLAWFVSRYSGRLKPTIEALIALPLVLPPTVLGFYLLVAFSPNNWLGQTWIYLTGQQFVFSFAGILFGSVIYSLPFVVQPLLAGFSQLGIQLELTSSSLGLPRYITFYKVVLPSIRANIVTAATLGFAHTLGEFGLILMIGGNIPNETQVVSIALYNYVETLEYANAHTLSFILLIMSITCLILLFTFNRRNRLSFETQ